MLEFLKAHFPQTEILEIPETTVLNSLAVAVSQVRPTDIIVLVGGGNLGNQYLDQRLMRNAAIKTFTKQPIVVFPQSAYYTKDFFGKIALRQDKKVFSTYKNLHIFLREKTRTILCVRTFRSVISIACRILYLP